MQIYMDDFTPYGEIFDQDLINLDKVQEICIEINLCLSDEACIMLSDQGIVLVHHISNKGIEVDLVKVKVYLNF